MSADLEETQRFLAACLSFRLALKQGQLISNEQQLLIKKKMYEMICDLQDWESRHGGALHSNSAPPPESSQTAP